MDLFQIAVILGSLHLVTGVDWKNPTHEMLKVGTALKDQAGKLKVAVIEEVETALKDPAGKVKGVGTTLIDQAGKLKVALNEEVRTADIRLMLKDPSKSTDTHPLLPSAQIDVTHASSIFQTGWTDYYSWDSNLDTEYKSVNKAGLLFFSKHYNSSLDSLFIFHDSCGNARDQSVSKIIEALKLRNFDVNYNIFLMDYERFTCGNLSPKTGYFKIGFIPQLESLSTEIGTFIVSGIINRKVRADQVNLLGLGMSTHLVGLVARYVNPLAGKKINSILGLDPPVSIRSGLFDNECARHIHIYHTFKLVPGMSPDTKRATADFVFGGAKRGPQCKTSVTPGCFKDFGVQLFVSTLLYPKLFPARWCPGYKKFSEHFCDFNDYTFVSFPPNKSGNGIYQMDINYVFPFGKGFEGIYQIEEEEDDTIGGSGDLSKLTTQEYLHRLEVEVANIRSELMSCIRRSPTSIMRCVMATHPAVKRLEKDQLIRKIKCEPFEQSPTGKTCKYETRTHNIFMLPF